jgi:hypothetical protein
VDTRGDRGGPAAVPRRPRHGRVSREPPGHPQRPRPRTAAAPRLSPSRGPRRCPQALRALTQRQERQQQRPRRQAPHARRAGATLPLLLLPRRLSSSSSSSSGCSRVRAPPLGRAPAPLCSRAEKSQRWGVRAPLAPIAPARLLPSLRQPAGPGSRPRRSLCAAPTASRKQKGRTAAPARLPARASHPALCQLQTQTFPSPSPLQVTEEAPGPPA